MEHEHVDTQTPQKQTQMVWPFPSLGSLLTIEEPAEPANEASHSIKLMGNKMESQPAVKEVHKPTNLFDNKEKYLAFKAQWSKLANQKALDSRMMLFYNVARGLEYFRGFTPITNKVKLENGQKADQALTHALDAWDYIAMPESTLSNEARYEFIKLFEGTIDDEFITKVHNYMV